MNLVYEQSPSGLGNTVQYNGNISAMQWTSNLSLGTVRDFAYRYTYDTLNRIKSAAFLKDSITWTNPKSAFNENGYSYDLNGNIKTLVRTGLNGKSMDNLSYDYGSGYTRSNRLLSVTDSQDLTTGFIDGNTTGSDYLYDVNGNMNVDNNKAISAISYNYLNLPTQVTKSTNDYLHYDYDAAGRKLAQQVFNTSGSMTKKTDYAGEFYYENDTLKFIQTPEGRVIMTGSTPEYQYHLKDHLGNVRMTFTTRRDIQADTATFETAHAVKDSTAFLRYADARRVNSTLFDHTNAAGSSHYAVRLNGSVNEKYGLAKSISVMPGDTINMKVFAKYVDPTSSNWKPVLMALLSQVASTQSGVVIDGSGYLTNGNIPNPYLGLAGESSSTGSGPKAYLNYIMFDRNYVPILNDVSQTNFVRMSGTLGKEDGSNVTFDSLLATVVAKQAGYMYIYLSNEETTPVDVYFDDFTVTQMKSPVVQQDDYYPFGLTFNEYQRENSLPNLDQYNDKEKQDELGLNWLDYGARMFMPENGRFVTRDPHADSYQSWTPYNYVANDPVLLIDPDGRDWNINKTQKDGKTNYDIQFIAAIVNESKNISLDDIISLAMNISNQIEDAFTINDDNVTTSVSVNIRVSKDGKTNDNEHVFRVTDDLPSNVMGDAEVGGRDIRINSSAVAMMNSQDKGNKHDQHGNQIDERDRTTGPHEAGHTAGLTHPNERTVWYDPSTWFLPTKQYIEPGRQADNLMYNGKYRTEVLKQDLSNGGKGYKINANQAQIMYENRDNR